MSYTFKTSGVFLPPFLNKMDQRLQGVLPSVALKHKNTMQNPTCNNNDNFLASQRELLLTGRGHRPEFAVALAAGNNSSRQIDAAHPFK